MKTPKNCKIGLMCVGLSLLTLATVFAEGIVGGARVIELVSSDKSAQGNLVELVCLATPANGHGTSGGWSVHVKKTVGIGSERKEELLVFNIRPGEKMPIGFGAIVGVKAEDQQASYEIVSISGPRRL